MVRKKFNRSEVLLAAAIFLVLVAILTFYIWYQAEAIRLGIQIRKCEVEIKLLQSEIQKLQIKKTSLLAPERIEKIARNSLGMVEPKDNQVIFK